jgi:hypothetical protein
LATLPIAAARVAGIPLARPLLFVAGAIVTGGALVAVAARRAVRWAAVQAIEDGHEDLGSTWIRRERARLLRPAVRRRLADTFELLSVLAWTRPPVTRALTPGIDTWRLKHLRPLTAELHATAALVACEDLPQARGVAACERLLAAPGSPVWGGTTEAVRAELERVCCTLEASRRPRAGPSSPAGSAPRAG